MMVEVNILVNPLLPCNFLETGWQGQFVLRKSYRNISLDISVQLISFKLLLGNKYYVMVEYGLLKMV